MHHRPRIEDEIVDATIGVESLLAKIVMSDQNVGKMVVTIED